MFKQPKGKSKNAKKEYCDPKPLVKKFKMTKGMQGKVKGKI